MGELRFNDLDRTDAFAAVEPTLPDLGRLLDAARIESCDVDAGGGLKYNYAAKPVTSDTLTSLLDLGREQQIVEKFRALAGGAIMNTGERRRVLHHLLRGELAGRVEENGADLGAFYREQRARFGEFAENVRSGRLRGSTGKPFTTVVQIGIGGSDLGPRALHLALEHGRFSAAPSADVRLAVRFIANVDPDDAAAVLGSIDLESTLFILVSKSGTTQETLTNHAFVVEAMKSSRIAGLRPSSHVVAVTSRLSPLAQSDEFLDAFFIDDYIGGRYSATSAVGGVALSCAFGPAVFDEMLAGAHAADRAALETPIERNAAALDALIGVYERSILGFSATAVLPYSQALLRFPAHLQQLDMESNGKRVNRFGAEIHYPTGPVVFGEPGTNGQHSFYQLLHQGTDIVPLQFVGFRASQIGRDVSPDGWTGTQKLNANLAAQIVAFAKGSTDADPNKSFPGNRPSSLLYGERLTPRSLGALLAHFENKIMFQGFCWNINSFDQEGVQLGKRLAGTILDGTADDEALIRYARMLGVVK